MSTAYENLRRVVKNKENLTKGFTTRWLPTYNDAVKKLAVLKGEEEEIRKKVAVTEADVDKAKKDKDREESGIVEEDEKVKKYLADVKEENPNFQWSDLTFTESSTERSNSTASIPIGPDILENDAAPPRPVRPYRLHPSILLTKGEQPWKNVAIQFINKDATKTATIDKCGAPTLVDGGRSAQLNITRGFLQSCYEAKKPIKVSVKVGAKSFISRLEPKTIQDVAPFVLTRDGEDMNNEYFRLNVEVKLAGLLLTWPRHVTVTEAGNICQDPFPAALKELDLRIAANRGRNVRRLMTIKKTNQPDYEYYVNSSHAQNRPDGEDESGGGGGGRGRGGRDDGSRGQDTHLDGGKRGTGGSRRGQENL